MGDWTFITNHGLVLVAIANKVLGKVGRCML